ncbi:MAG: hypothetical protein M1834_009129 [Cirrosporium novae-zelandiae]|nr:MAG: hypothetical protein M1834_009129 [Cirrosporium novae-zelandiae]
MPPRNPSNFNFRALTMPLAAFTMAGVLFLYARTSIHAAKRNAQRHRETDGGQISWHKENLRSHGKLERPEEQGVVGELLRGKEKKVERGEERSQVEKIVEEKRRGGKGVGE